MKDPRKYYVYRTGEHPKPKRHYYPYAFTSRKAARNFCRARYVEPGTTIVHPDGTEELFTREEKI